MVRPGRESFKRFISTILEQLPAYIENYPPSDQLLLTEFLSILQHYEEADYQRNKLSKRFEEYNNRILGTDQYLQTAFLWFTYNYFTNANLLLNVSKFHASLFYEYLVKHLRGSSDTPGVFGLISENIPLSNLTWEELQYESNKLLVPLTENQLQILKVVYSFIDETGINSLDPNKLRAAVANQVSFPRKIKPSDELKRFFTRLDGRWSLHFSSPAFGLDRVIFHFQLQNSVLLEDIIDFQNPTNTVLSVSDVYIVKNLLNTYLGILLVPTQEIKRLEGYLKYCESQGYLILKKLSKISSTRRIASLSSYQANIGWKELSLSKIHRLTLLLTSKYPKKRQAENSTLFIPPPFNLKWKYNQHPLSSEIVELYSKTPKEYSFPNLPLKSRKKHQESKDISKTEIGLLKHLHYNRVFRIGFLSYRLMSEFSLDSYWIILPTIPMFQLKRFLNLLPFSEIYLTDKYIHIWSRLTPKLVNWIENDLNWTVCPIILNHYPANIRFEWFDTETLRWKVPNILKNEINH